MPSDLVVARHGGVTLGYRLSRRRMVAAGAAALAAVVGGPQSISAQPRSNPSQRNPQPLRIAIMDFVAVQPQSGEVAMGIAHIIADNLKLSAAFHLIDTARLQDKITSIDGAPSFADWRSIADAVVTGRVNRVSDERLNVEFRLWDIAAGQQLMGKWYGTQFNSWRRIGAIISDDIYAQLTGEKGYFESQDQPKPD